MAEVKSQEIQENTKAFIEKVIFINRVTKVTKGGKTLGFTALVVVGDGESCVGYALGKASEVAEAIRKGIRGAKKNMVKINKKDATIPHEVIGEFGAVKIIMKPALPGTGVISCQAVRSICECVGIHNILSKVVSKSTNPINIVKATFVALSKLKEPKNMENK